MSSQENVSLETQDSKNVRHEETDNSRNVPELRFQEFTDEWVEKRILDIGSIQGGGTPNTNNEKYWGGDINWYTPSDIIGKKYLMESMRKITREGLKNSSATMLPKDTILISSRATIGEMSIIKNDSTTNQGFQSLIVNKYNSNEFFYYYGDNLKKDFIKNASGSTFLEISKKDIQKIKIFMPILEEQEKIAKFLSLVDKKIEFMEKTLGLYKKISKLN